MTDQTKLPARPAYDPAAALMDPASFEHLYRVGRMLASSALFPEHLRKGSPEQAAANGALVMNMAVRMREDPLTVAQAVYFVGGKPGWSTQYVIAKANQHGTFSDQIDWNVAGEGPTLSVTAFATLAKGGRKVSMTCDMEMAKAEGWTKNSKYSTMPEVMLRYRSAAFLIRMYCPEVMVGIPAQIEIELEGNMRDVTPRQPPRETRAAEPEPAVEAEEVEDAEAAVAPDATEDPDLTQDEAFLNGETKAEAKVEAKAETKKTAGPEPDMEVFEHLAQSILRDIADVAADGVDDVLDLYEAQIEQLLAVSPDLHKMVMDAAAEKKGE